MYTSKRTLLKVISLIALAAVLASCSGTSGGQAAAAQVASAPVQTITAVTTVSGSGSTLALQTVSVSWKASGTVGTVNVKTGDQVKAGDALMTIDPKSISNMAQLNSDVLSAQEALDNLLHPTALSVANAQQAVFNAQDTLDKLTHPTASTVANAQQAVAKAQDTLDAAQKTLSSSKSVDVAFFQDQVQKAQDALTNAQQNAAGTDIGSLPVQLRQAQVQLTTATNVYNNAKDAFAKCPACLTVFAYDRTISWTDAVNLYTDAVNKVTQIQTQIDQTQRANSTNVSDAQTALDTAKNDLAAALQGPVTLTVNVNQAAVSVAKGALADAQTALDKVLNPDATAVAVAQATVTDTQTSLAKLLNPDPVDVAAAQAKLANAQSALDDLTLKAPVDGEVTDVNFQPGDTASSSTAAVVLTNRSKVRVEALVDESDVAKVKLGDPVTITVGALTSIALPGTVVWVDPTGTTTQGLVKYTVRVDATKPNPNVLLGMSANVLITTNSKAGTLAVPLQALQYDTQGEFVNVVQSDGSLQRVPVQSGQIQGSLVVVDGALKNGDQVELATATASTTTTGGGFGGLGGLGGGGGPRGGP